MASGPGNRIKRPNTWLHRPMLQNVKKALANPEPSTHGTKRTSRPGLLMSVHRLSAQPVDATQALNLSGGVSNCKVSRGRSFSGRATLFRWACECTDKSVPFGKYCLSRPLVFSFDPRCHGLCGSQKYTSILVANVKRR